MITCLDIENTFTKGNSMPYNGNNILVSVGFLTNGGEQNYLYGVVTTEFYRCKYTVSIHLLIVDPENYNSPRIQHFLHIHIRECIYVCYVRRWRSQRRCGERRKRWRRRWRQKRRLPRRHQGRRCGRLRCQGRRRVRRQGRP